MFSFFHRRESWFNCASCSERGAVRRENQDHVIAQPAKGLVLVADGMGGGEEGERASRMVANAVGSAVRSGSDFGDRIKAADDAIAKANADILAYSRARNYRQMGSTVAMMLVDLDSHDRAVIGHVGDSRIYRLRNGVLKQLTRDHTIANALDRSSSSSVPTSRRHPLSHVLLRAIGTESTVSVDWRKVTIRPGDRFLLCSDGVSDMISDEIITKLMTDASNASSAVAAIAESVNAAGAEDNFSAVCMFTRIER